jgi:hypothetical protein
MWADESRDESRDELRWARSSPARREEVFPQATTPKWLKDAAAMLRRERERWAQLIPTMGITVD